MSSLLDDLNVGCEEDHQHSRDILRRVRPTINQLETGVHGLGEIHLPVGVGVTHNTIGGAVCSGKASNVLCTEHYPSQCNHLHFSWGKFLLGESVKARGV